METAQHVQNTYEKENPRVSPVYQLKPGSCVDFKDEWLDTQKSSGLWSVFTEEMRGSGALGRSSKTLKSWSGKDRLEDQSRQRAEEVWRWQDVIGRSLAKYQLWKNIAPTGICNFIVFWAVVAEFYHRLMHTKNRKT